MIARGPLSEEVIGVLRRPAGDIVFGVQATDLLEQRLADHLLSAWRADRSSLRQEPRTLLR